MPQQRDGRWKLSSLFADGDGEVANRVGVEGRAKLVHVLLGGSIVQRRLTKCDSCFFSSFQKLRLIIHIKENVHEDLDVSDRLSFRDEA